MLVKLQCVWDRRTVLSGSRNLADIPKFRRSVYIYPDKPLEVRRGKTFERMKAHAIAAGKQVSVKDDVLCVNGVNVYSLSQGVIRKFRSGASAMSNG